MFSVLRDISVKEQAVTYGKTEPVGIVRLSICMEHLTKAQRRIVRMELLQAIGFAMIACVGVFVGFYLFVRDDTFNGFLLFAILAWLIGMGMLLASISGFRTWRREKGKLEQAEHTGAPAPLVRAPLIHIPDKLFSAGVKTATDVVLNHDKFMKLVAAGVDFQGPPDPALFLPIDITDSDKFYWGPDSFVTFFERQVQAERNGRDRSLVEMTSDMIRDPILLLKQALDAVEREKDPFADQDTAVTIVTNDLYAMCGTAMLGGTPLESNRDYIRGRMQELSDRHGMAAMQQVMMNIQARYSPLAVRMSKIWDGVGGWAD